MLLPGKYCQNLILKYATEELVTSILRPERYERASPVMSGQKGWGKRMSRGQRLHFMWEVESLYIMGLCVGVCS